MSDVGSGRLGGERGRAGVCEEVQHLGARPPFGLRLPYEPARMFVYVLPVGRLLGKYAYMLERSESQTQPEVETYLCTAVADIPLIVHLLQTLPGAAVFLSGLAETGARREARMHEPGPFGFAHGLVPECLRLGTRHDVTAVALQLLTSAGINDLVVLPGRCRILNFHR